jgi:histidyl-tRNA synthetase
MVQKEIKLLQQQIDKLYADDFELAPWKKYTVIFLERIFGTGNEKIRMINEIDFEFSSWSLRDASGNESYEEKSKKEAQEILLAAIDELKIFGLPDKSKKEAKDQTLTEILNCLLDELKGSQVKQLKTILSSDDNEEEKKRKMKDILQSLGESGAAEVLSNILLHREIQTVLLK